MRISDWSSDVCSSDLPRNVDAMATLDVRLAEAERVIADAQLRQARAEGRLDPSIGVGVRQLRETGDRALIASLSVPLPVFDRNQGNIAAARRSEERRVGKECVSTCRSRGSPYT